MHVQSVIQPIFFLKEDLLKFDTPKEGLHPFFHLTPYNRALVPGEAEDQLV